MGEVGTVMMSAGGLEERDNTFSQFVQLFDLWLQDICKYI
jgi:hypothetical protein